MGWGYTRYDNSDELAEVSKKQACREETLILKYKENYRFVYENSLFNNIQIKDKEKTWQLHMMFGQQLSPMRDTMQQRNYNEITKTVTWTPQRFQWSDLRKDQKLK